MVRIVLSKLGQTIYERLSAYRPLFAIPALVFLLFFPSRAYGADVGGGKAGTLTVVKQDLAYTRTTVWADAQSLVRAPLAIGKVKEVTLRQALFGIAVLGSIGGMIALDDDIRKEARHIDDRAASDLQNASLAVSFASLAALYGAGLMTDDEQWRHGALIGAESVFVSFGLAKLAKVSFGRERPDAGEGAKDWFEGGRSFVSDVITPAFAAAEAVSETFDHNWWVTIPAYTAATAVGVGRMGQDRHWASDILASALIGVGTTKLFTYLHHQHEQKAPRLTLSPVMTPGGTVGLRFSLRF